MKKSILLCLLSSALFAQKDIYFGGNLYKSTYSSYYVYNGIVISKVKPTSFSFTPSLFLKTQKGNLREFELSNFKISKIDELDKYNYYSSTNQRDTTIYEGSKNNSFVISYTLHYYSNFFKKKSKNWALGIHYATSLGFEHYENTPSIYYYRTSNLLTSNLRIGLHTSYIYKQLLFKINYLDNTLFIKIGKQFIDAPQIPSKYKYNPVFTPYYSLLTIKNFALTVAYKF